MGFFFFPKKQNQLLGCGVEAPEVKSSQGRIFAGQRRGGTDGVFFAAYSLKVRLRFLERVREQFRFFSYKLNLSYKVNRFCLGRGLQLLKPPPSEDKKSQCTCTVTCVVNSKSCGEISSGEKKIS